MAGEPTSCSEAAGVDRAPATLPASTPVPDACTPELLDLALKAGRFEVWSWEIGPDRVTSTPALASLHGLSEATAGVSLDRFAKTIQEEDRARFRAALEDAVRKGGGDAFRIDYRVAPPGGPTCWIEMHGRLLLDALYESGRVVAVCADVTERREAAERERLLAEENARLREQARDADRAKSDFLSIMSHELRTPLNAIIGYTELWLLGVPALLPEGLRSQVERVRECAQHLLQLIEEILTFTRIEAGTEEARPEPTDITALTREVAALLQPRAAERGLQIGLTLPQHAVRIETDAAKVRHILSGLLSNAIKFTDQGEIRVRLEERGGEVFVDVEDAGVGIAPEHHERIFEPFWQVEPTRTRSRDGTGLGLSVARRLARLLGGDVLVRSAPGVGSTFTLRLPGPALASERPA